MLLFRVLSCVASTALSLLPLAVPAITLAAGTHSCLQFGRFVREVIDNVQKVGDIDKIRGVKEGRVRKNKGRRRVKLARLIPWTIVRKAPKRRRRRTPEREATVAVSKWTMSGWSSVSSVNTETSFNFRSELWKSDLSWRPVTSRVTSSHGLNVAKESTVTIKQENKLKNKSSKS